MINIEPHVKQELFDIIFLESPQPIAFLDISSLKFLEVNQAAVDYYQYSRDEFLNMTVLDIRAIDDQDDKELLVDSLSGIEITKRLSKHKLKDGTINYCQVVTYPIEYDGRQARLTIMNDQAWSSLYVNRLNLISKATHDAVWDWNIELNELWWNESFLDLFLYKKEQLEHTLESWTSRIHPEDQQRVINGIHYTIDSGEAYWSDEYRFMRGDGTYSHVLDRGYTIFKAGKVVRIVGSMMDITERIQLQKARHESETLIETLTSASPTALWMSDETGKMIYVNQKWLEWSNAGIAENLGNGWLDIVYAEDRERVLNVYDNAYLVKKTFEIDHRILFKDGSVRWVIATGIPRLDNENRFLGFVGSVTDISRQKYLEQQKDGFINTVSHELKTPIAALKGYDQLLSRSNSVKDAQGLNFLNRMHVQINRLDLLVQDLLDISRIESGRLTFNESDIEVNILLAELVNDLQLLYPEHRLMVTENEACKIHGDRNRVIQLITNLVDNAVKYSPSQSKVYLKLTCDEQYMTISVQDFGRGISKEQSPFIFNRFFQVNNVYRNPGLGIGLYVCREVVSRMGGEIWFESVLGTGTTFNVKLPRKID